MTSPPSLSGLPTLAAVEALPVLEGARPCASIQLSSQYFDNQLSVYDALDGEVSPNRVARLRRSRSILRDASASVDSVTVSALDGACHEIREAYLEMPEVSRLRAAFPGACVVVPELLRASQHIRFGMRVYFFPEGAAPNPQEIVRRNVEAVVGEDPGAFERYTGRLHGYPECCIEHFEERSRAGDSPEVRSVEPLESTVRPSRLGTGGKASITDVVPDLFERRCAYAFFSRKFFPGPGCDAACDRGEDIYATLAGRFDETLARDAFRLNAALAYVVAANTMSLGRRKPPVVGTLGREQLYLYLPLSATLTASRYG